MRRVDRWGVDSSTSGEKVFGTGANIVFGTGPMPFTSVSLRVRCSVGSVLPAECDEGFEPVESRSPAKHNETAG